MSSVEGYESGNELNGAEEGTGELVVSGRDSPELFEIVEETFDQIAFAVKYEISLPWRNAICLRRNDRCDLALLKTADEGVGVISLVSQKGLRLDFLQKRLGLPQVR